MNSKIKIELDSLLLFRKSSSATLLAAFLLVPLTAHGAGVVTNCTEADLQAAMSGGGVVTFACDGTIVLSSSILINTNTVLDASGHQVAISGNGTVRVFYVASNTTFSVASLTIANGLATNGAGILNEGGTVSVANSTFYNNKVLGAAGPYWPGAAGESVAGGAVANSGLLNLVGCNFTNNVAVGGAESASYGGGDGFPGGTGAGGAVWNSGQLLANGCTFAGNSATGGTGGQGSGGIPLPWPTPGYAGGAGGDGAGGALFNSGTARLVNCTVALNVGVGGAGGQGGPGYPNPDYPPPPSGPNGAVGLSVGGIQDASGQCFLTNCTAAFNSGTGIRTTEAEGAKMINSLLAGNLPGGNGSGVITDLGHNLSSDATCAFTNPSSLNNTYPLLGPLTNNGGFTLTIALLPGCLAIDAGDTAAAPPTDQRGIARPFGLAADIGAYEFNEGTNPGPSTVVTECTEAGLRAAMAGGGHVTFACDGTIQLSNTVVIATNTFLDAADHQITLQGNGARLFQVSSEVVFSVANLVITGAGIDNGGGSLNATNCLFSRNVAPSGGAVWNRSGAACLSVCVFTDNHAFATAGGGYAQGGALNNSGTLLLDLCTFVANSAVGSEGIAGDWYGAPGGDGGDAAGGAICNFGVLTICRSTFTTNLAIAGIGTSGFIGHHGDPGMDGGAGGSGGAGGNAIGGALYNAGTARVSNSTFAYNSGTGGNGGAGGDGGPNYGGPGSGGEGGSGGAGGDGVGALFNAGSVEIMNSTFAFNSGWPGGGGSGGDGGSGNLGGSGGAGGNGGSGVGALYGQSSSGWITNCTFAGNSGGSGSGGSGGTAGHTDYPCGDCGGSPGAAGTSGSGTGGIKISGGVLVNTLLAANSRNCSGSITDLGHNLSSDGTCGFTNTGSLNNADPKLGPPADNGGPTFTMALLAGSPAIDAGDNVSAPPTDQRGVPRPFGAASDIGAYEYAALLRVSRSPGNALNLLLCDSIPGQTCHLLTSTTLSSWVCVATNQIGVNGRVLFQENCNPVEPQRFYKVVLP